MGYKNKMIAVTSILLLLIQNSALALDSPSTTTGSNTPPKELPVIPEYYEKGYKLCETRWDQKATADPCSEAKIAISTQRAQLVTGGIHAAAAVTCWVGCFYPPATGACTAASIGAGIGEMVTNIANGASAESIITGLATSLPTTGLTLLTQLNSGAESAASSAGEAAAETGKEIAKEGAKEGGTTATKSSINIASCLAAAMSTGQSVMKFYGSTQSRAQAEKAWVQKYEIASDTKIETFTNKLPENIGATLSNTSGGSNHNSAPPTTPTGPGRRGTGFTPEDLTTAAIKDYGSVLDAFSKTTGASPADLFGKIAAGANPVVAAAELSKNSLGPDSSSAMAESIQNQDKLAQQFKNTLKDSKVNLADANANSVRFGESNKRSVASSSNGFAMPDLSALMAGLIPGKDVKDTQTAQGARGVSLLSKAKTDSDGFYPSVGPSLFDVIGSRYTKVQGRMIGSESSSAPTSSIPANPYLKSSSGTVMK